MHENRLSLQNYYYIKKKQKNIYKLRYASRTNRPFLLHCLRKTFKLPTHTSTMVQCQVIRRSHSEFFLSEFPKSRYSPCFLDRSLDILGLLGQYCLPLNRMLQNFNTHYNCLCLVLTSRINSTLASQALDCSLAVQPSQFVWGQPGSHPQ